MRQAMNEYYTKKLRENENSMMAPWKIENDVIKNNFLPTTFPHYFVCGAEKKLDEFGPILWSLLKHMMYSIFVGLDGVKYCRQNVLNM